RLFAGQRCGGDARDLACGDAEVADAVESGLRIENPAASDNNVIRSLKHEQEADQSRSKSEHGVPSRQWKQRHRIITQVSGYGRRDRFRPQSMSSELR